jgi:hypothetical protein
VVTLAPKLEVVDTLKLAAEEIAASRFSAPVMVIAPRLPLVAPPTIPLNSTSLVPTLIVNVFASDASELTRAVKSNFVTI